MLSTCETERQSFHKLVHFLKCLECLRILNSLAMERVFTGGWCCSTQLEEVLLIGAEPGFFIGVGRYGYSQALAHLLAMWHFGDICWCPCFFCTQCTKLAVSLLPLQEGHVSVILGPLGESLMGSRSSFAVKVWILLAPCWLVAGDESMPGLCPFSAAGAMLGQSWPISSPHPPPPRMYIRRNLESGSGAVGMNIPSGILQSQLIYNLGII